jgi:hypothetical protein
VRAKRELTLAPTSIPGIKKSQYSFGASDFMLLGDERINDGRARSLHDSTHWLKAASYIVSRLFFPVCTSMS